MSPQAQGEPSSEQVAALFEKHRTGLLTIIFTDLVDSTALMQRLGNQAGATFLKRRRQLVREVLAAFPQGEEIETAGDSFLLVFTKPSDAVRFALTLQAKSRQSAQESGVPVQERIGLHLGELVISVKETESKAKDLYGIELATCSRVMSLAEGGQILLTRGVFDSARQVLKGEDIPGIGQLHWVHHGSYLLKGVDEPVDVYEVGEEGKRAPEAPQTSDKAQRQVRPDEESVLGWRPAIGQNVPDTRWALEEKLGEGGFGEVWLGRHQTMKERRVFKFCFRADRVRSLKREMTLFRVLKERIGDHPHIVRLLEVYFEAPPYYVEMDYVEGPDLKSWCETQGGAERVAFEQKLEIVAQVADALQAAHDAGVIHRDVKPANILVSRAAADVSRRIEQGDGGSTVEGATDAPSPRRILAKLTDFGIGQVVSEEALSGVTRAGFTQTILADSASSKTGTHLYMAPELLAGKPASVRSDIYSLGVVLYQLLVGDLTRPLTTDWSAEISDPLLRDDLQRCFAGNPNERFPGAGQLATNLRTLPDRQHALAEQETAMAAQAKAAYRRGVLRTAIAASTIVIAMAALALWAVRSQRETERMADTRSQELYVAQIGLVQQAWEEGNLQRAQTLLADQRPAPDQADLRGFEWRYLWGLCQDESRETLLTFTNGVGPLVFSPDGRTLAVVSGQTVRLWDFPRRSELTSLQGHTNITSLAFSSSSPPLLATAAADGTIILWDLATSALLAKLPTGDDSYWFRSNALAFSPDGSTLAWACAKDGTLQLWDVDSKQLVRSIRPGHGELGDPALCVAFSPDGRILASGGGDTKVRLWDPATGEPISAPLDGHTAFVLGVAFSPDGTRFATVGFDAQVLLWDVATRQAGPPLLGHNGGVPSLAFSPDGKTLVTGGFDHTIRFWSVAASRQTGLLRGHRAGVGSLAFAPDGESLVSTSGDGTLKVWDAAIEPNRNALTNHSGWVSGVALSPDGKTLASADYHTPFTVSLWDLPTRRRMTNFPGPTGADCALTFSPDGNLLASGGGDRIVRVWDLKGQRMTATNSCEFGIGALAFSPNGVILAAAGDGLRAWQVGSGQEKEAWLKGDTEGIRSVAFSASGEWLATSSLNGRITLWDAADGKEQASFQDEGRASVNSLAISGDDRYVALGRGNGVVTLFDLAQGKDPPQLTIHTARTSSLAFSPDSKTLASASWDGTVRLWNVATGQAALAIKHVGPIVEACFSNDGTLMATCGADATVRLWHAPPFTETDADQMAQLGAVSLSTSSH
jgi:WD40 repeat protein/class 3 adenylate cyclase